MCQYCNAESKFSVRSFTTASSAKLEVCARHLAAAVRFFVMKDGETVVKRLA